MRDIIVTLTLIPWCEPPPLRDPEIVWAEVSRQVLLEAARGESFDADGNQIPAISYHDGKLHRYVVDLFGELVEVTK